MKSWLAIITASVLMFAAQRAFALWSNEEFRLSDTKSVSVTLADDASDGCWTNLRETREYAEEKLRAKGANIVPQPVAGLHNYELAVSVNAYRTKFGCVANVNLQIRALIRVPNLKGDQLGHFALVAGSNQLFSGYDKMNNEVLNEVKEFISRLK